MPDPNESFAGTIDTPADQDNFLFNLQQGQHYIFDVTGGTLNDPTLRLLDLSGNSLAYNDDTVGLDPRVEFTAPSDGLYRLQVESYAQASTGSYTLSERADDVANDTHTLVHLAPDTFHWGNIESAGDHDFYAVSLTGGQNYNFDVLEVGLGDPVLAVRDSANHVVASNDDYVDLNPHIDYTAPYSGTFYLDVSGYSTHTGQYLVVA